MHEWALGEVEIQQSAEEGWGVENLFFSSPLVLPMRRLFSLHDTATTPNKTDACVTKKIGYRYLLSFKLIKPLW